MQQVFDQLYSNGALLVLWGALLFHLVVPIPISSHPTVLWRAFAKILTDKVNVNNHYSQSLISGSLSWMLMMIPALAVLVALKPLVWQPQLFDLALLLLAIDWRNSEKLGHQLTDALAKQDKVLARRLLKPRLNRNTATLSALGLGKAGAETIILGYGRNVVCVVFWYGLTGGIGALLFRLMSELARAWSPSRSKFLPFGLPAARILAIFEFIPLCLFSLMIVVGKNMHKIVTLVGHQSKTWSSRGPALLLSALGNKLELSLGGPAIYNDKKTVRAKLGGRIAPSALHIGQIQKLLAWRLYVWIVIQSIVMFLFYQGL
ncbi:cobalamin biosynthesis family protein [Vibrio sp. TH_r3]|uniref:cobalamin biosynthesis family protein n=1 Tax=Vibrio sp. TH_r3 TaxID=3082084 RepID=UPI00295370B9|nr:cobalamin biosynthesis family protein [Vibrio sp. TH_r3]MDV7105196.1 cobalamin biosynthesis family protein [Vibrio sp. TH_r3]